MCAIAGIIGCADPDRIERMTQIMAHRGPDSWGVQVFAADDVALGHRRLSILDLSPRGHQPMADPEEKCWITYNGEIYNYRELRQDLEKAGFVFRSDTDTEVLLYAYQHWASCTSDRFPLAVMSRMSLSWCSTFRQIAFPM